MLVDPRHERLLVLAPTGRDAELAQRELVALASVEIVRSADNLLAEMALGVGVVVVAEEALTKSLVDSLISGLAAQGAWSDVPFIILAGTPLRAEYRTGQGPRDVLQELAALGNLAILERPVAVRTLVGVARVALESRRRQYGMRLLHDNLQALNRGKDEFLAMLGHELRNPLGAATSALALLQTSPADGPRRQRYLDILQRQTRAMTRMLDDLLDVSRVSLGKLQLQLEQKSLDLEELVRRAIDGLQAHVERARHTLTFEAAEGPFPVHGDPVRFEQIIANVVVNAIKYTPPGGRIQVGVRRDAVDVVVEVRDSGIGITSEMLPNVFGLFAQASDGAQGGLGVGLALVDTLVRMHGGRVSIASEGLGKGCQVEVRIPLAIDRVAAEPPVAQLRATGSFRVLIVEDDQDVRETLREVLEAKGHQVAVAMNAADGLIEAARTRPDLLLSDIGLPGMNGYELAQRVRKALVPVPYLVAVTGYGLPEDRRRAREAGFDAHMLKPVDLAALNKVFEVVAERNMESGQ